MIGIFLYCTQIVENTILMEFNYLASALEKRIEETVSNMEHYLNYCTTHSEATIKCLFINVVIHASINTSYL